MVRLGVKPLRWTVLVISNGCRLKNITDSSRTLNEHDAHSNTNTNGKNRNGDANLPQRRWKHPRWRRCQIHMESRDRVSVRRSLRQNKNENRIKNAKGWTSRSEERKSSKVRLATCVVELTRVDRIALGNPRIT